MTATKPDRLRQASRYLVSLATGILAGAVFVPLRTPIPVPPLIGLAGMLGIAAGEFGMTRALALVRGWAEHRRQTDRAARTARQVESDRGNA